MKSKRVRVGARIKMVHLLVILLIHLIPCCCAGDDKERGSNMVEVQLRKKLFAKVCYQITQSLAFLPPIAP